MNITKEDASVTKKSMKVDWYLSNLLKNNLQRWYSIREHACNSIVCTNKHSLPQASTQQTLASSS